MENPRVFLDLNIGGQPAGRLVIELFADSTPITVENFRGSLHRREGNRQEREATPLQRNNLPPRDTQEHVQWRRHHRRKRTRRRVHLR
ncbi:hypothetical protein Dsin_018647 [Dipteronia sinensis]|uniref:PPIase cyclophilin-type domain-containing protein n=1 Tax=Dipteronia sinensis TaxID=43782 RepID=A0AAE0A780_9ROSI|nr:hypothetical protein Dsin_018647 [Dipteronia sinensis]